MTEASPSSLSERRRRRVFLTGATGYLGSRLATELVRRGHDVRALCRPASIRKLPSRVTAVVGDALNAASYRGELGDADTFVHLIGVAHPSPRKAALFQSVDLESVHAALEAVANADVKHFVYVSVAHPAPVMRAFVEARRRAEEAIASAGLPRTVLRPWYVLGPGHRWPLLLLPLYWSASLVPSLREGARRLGLVTLRSMLRALVHAVEHPSQDCTLLEVPAIRRF